MAYIQPDAEPEEDPENITLPPETELVNKQACTLNNLPLKKEVETSDQDNENVFIMEEAEEPMNEHMSETHEVMDDTNFDAITDAVKATLAAQPGMFVT